jgi:energy-converting hydrogenase A subunit G
MVYIPATVPTTFLNMYLPTIYAALIVAFIGLTGIAIQKRDIHILILTDVVGLAMLMIVAALGTDLAEALVLPGFTVDLAETLAISEILLSREMHKMDKKASFLPLPLTLDMEIMTTAPNFISLILIGYGVWLSGFTGGVIVGAGLIFYVFCRKARGLPIKVINGISGISGIAWTLWIIGFALFFAIPKLWLLSLLLAAFGLLLKVAGKMGVIGTLMREEYNRK